MNRIYRVVFNAKLGLWQVASESCKARKKSGGRKATLVAATAAAAFVSVNALAQGTITATGSVSPTPPVGAASWDTALAIDVGSSTTGLLELKGGATVNVTGVQSVTVGKSAGGNGKIVVDGAGSVFNLRTLIRLGFNDGKGVVEVTNGGAFNAQRFFINESGTGSRLLVSGAGSTVQLSGELKMMGSNPGDAGEVIIEGGGSVAAKNVRIVGGAGAQARLEAKGAGSQLTVTDGITMEGEVPPSHEAILLVQDGAKVQANDIKMVGSAAADYTAAIYVGAESLDAADAVAAGELAVGSIDFGLIKKGQLNLNHTDTDYSLTSALISSGTGDHQLNQISGHTTLSGDSSGFKGKTTVSGGTLVVQNKLGGAAEVTGGTLQYGAAGVGETSNLSSLTVSGANSALLIKGTAALEVAGQVAISNNAKLEMDVVPSAATVVQADSFTIGAGTVLDISGITNVSQLGTDLVLFNTTSGIQNDFASVIVHGYQPQAEDYLALNTRKSDDGKQYVAKKGLSWTANNNLANGVFTLNAGTSFDADEDLKDEKANAATGWDGKTLTKKGEGTLTLSGNNSYTGDTIVEGGVLQISKDSNLGDANSVLRLTGQNTTLATTADFTSNREIDLQQDATLSVASGKTVDWAGDLKSTGTTLNKTGAGTLVLSGANNGVISHNIAEGRLQISSAANLGTGTDAINLSGGTLATSGAHVNIAREILLSKTSTIEAGEPYDFTLTGKVSGPGDLVKTGEGRLLLENTANAYANTRVMAGKLNGNAVSIKGNIHLNAATAAVEFAQDTNATFAGNITGSGEVYKYGTGDLTLSADNTSFTGELYAREGKLIVLASGGDRVFVDDGDAILQFGDGVNGGASTITDHVSVWYEGTLAIYGPATLSVGNSVDLERGTTLDVEVSSKGPVLTADTVELQGGKLVLRSVPLKENEERVVIRTTNGITGDFGEVSAAAGEGVSPVDYLTVSGYKSQSGKEYLAKYGLSWLATGAQAHGTFTLVDATDTYNVVSVLGNKTANTNWDGRTLTKKGAGTLTLSAANTYSGNTIVEGGTVSISQNNNLGTGAGTLVLKGGDLATTASFNLTRKVDLQKTGAMNVATATTLDVKGTVGGAGGLTKAGEGKLVLSGTNTYAGGTQLAAGELVIAKNENLGNANGAVQIVGQDTTLSTTGSFATQRELDLQEDATVSVAANTSVEWNGTVKGTGTTLNKEGEGTLVLGGTNGAISHNIAEGKLQVSSDANLGTGTDAITLSGGKLAASASFATAKDINVSQGSGIEVINSADTLALSGKVSGTADLVKTGAGVLELQNAANAYANTDVRAGTVKGTAETIKGNVKTVANATVEFAQVSNATFNGVISGNGRLTKLGTGELTLGAQNNGFSGVMDVLSGKLVVLEATTAGEAQVYGGSTLQYGNGTEGGLSTVASQLSVNDAGSTLAIYGPATLKVNGIAMFADDTKLDISLGSNGAALTADQMLMAGNVSLNLSGLSSLAMNQEVVIIDTTTGITGDFASVTVDGSSTVDYLTVGARKSIDEKQYLAKYGLSWLAKGSNAHGTFTLANASNTFNVTENLTDEAANAATGWDGKTLTKKGDGTLTLSGTNSYTGNTIVEGGTVSVSRDDNLGALASNLVLNGGGLAVTDSFTSARKVDLQQTGAVDVAADKTLGLNGTIEGAGGLTKAGTGKLVLGGTNTYAGDTVLEGGELEIAKDENLGDASGAVQIAGQGTTLSTTGSFTTQRELDLQEDATVSIAAATSVDWSGDVKGAGTTLLKKGAGTLALGGTNGAISHNIAEGTLEVASVANLGTGTDAITLSGGTLATTASFTNARDLEVSKTSGIDVASGTELAVSGKVSGAGDLVKKGTGTLHLQNSGNAYGNTEVQAGLLKGEAAAIKGNLKNDGAVEFAQATNATFTGAISGTGSLEKTGAGELTLSAQNTGFTGHTKVSEGKLVVLGTAGSSAEVTGGALEYGNGTTNAANSLQGDLDVSGAGSALGVMGPATLAVAGDVNMANNTSLSLGAMDNGAVLTAKSVQLGSDVNFMLNGVSQAGEQEVLVIDTTNGINGDFASVNVGGASGVVDYLTVGTRKSADSKQFFAKYGLSWLANNNNAHGTFTLATAAEQFLVGTDLSDQTANPLTGWDGKTLTKAGAGTLVLSGNNSYTGDTLVQGGVLAISSDKNLGAASSNLVMNGGGLATTASFNSGRHMDLQQTAAVNVAADTKVDWQGSIDGAGGLTKAGAGTLVLSGASNYAGVTTIAGGTLQIDSDARLGTAPNMVFDGGGLATTASFNSGREIALNKTGFVDVAASTELGLQGDISGAGGLIKVGTGTLTLAGTNSYAGDTTLGGGITQISSAANLGANSGAVVFEGGSLAATASLNSTHDFTLNKTGNVAVAAGATMGVDGAVTGKGDLLKTGQGTLALSNTANAYGNTLVQEGTLVAQAGSVSGHIANAGTVVLDQAADATFANDIQALNNQKGTMVKKGQGTLTLAGQSALDWNVEAGQLATAAERFAGNANIASGATLALNQAADAAYAGQLAGTGELRKQGAGMLQVTGDSSAFNGQVNVDSGVLAVNGKLGAKQALIADGATLAGNGTIGSGNGATVTIAKGGVLSPGNSIDKLTVDGDLVFQSGSRFDVEVDPVGTASDLVHVTGNATLSGGVAHIGETGNYQLNAAYTILTADGSVNGTFDSVKSNFAFLNPELKYNYSDSEVQLILKRNGTTFDARGRTPNQRATARGIESMGSTSTHGVYTAIAKLPDDSAVIERSLDALSGEIYASTKTALIDDSRFVRDAATDRMRSAFGGAGSSGSAVMADRKVAQANSTGTAAWAQTFGNWGDTDSDGNAHKLKRRTYGFLVGADTPLGDGAFRVGALAGYSYTKADANDVSSTNKSDNYHVGLYGGGQWEALGVRMGVAHTWHEMRATRSVSIPGFSDDLKSSPKARTTQIFADVGYNIEAGSVQLEPFANLAYVNLHSSSFNERGGDAALKVKSDNTNISYMTLGSRFSTEMDVGSTTVMANASLGWRHVLGGVTPESTHRFSAGNAFTVYGVPLSRDSAVLEAGVGVKLSRSVTLGVSYQGQLGSDGNDHGVRANLGIEF
ncbi:autotransporter-associated beta strand repeat-containing protein [Paenalcaligenes sp. Me131]|uniref:autotransporter-associated beta strand repeat-containing protein n=1 Tax=Paenalcaligenes sp. Me131 TaxID=3392636 RepID=UPI003D272622